MRTDRYPRRALMVAAATTLLATVACTAATTASLAATTRPASPAAPVPGWRIVKTIGPDSVNVSGLLTGSAGIWALGAGYAMHWTGASWATVRLPVFPLPFGDYATYGDVTAAGAKDAWVVVSIYDASHALVNTILAYWTGTTWRLLSSPADILGSMAPDGGGGLWADGIDINPGGFWLLYHFAGGHWTSGQAPAGVDVHSPTPLTRIPGTGSLWATGTPFGTKGYYGVILKYGP